MAIAVITDSISCMPAEVVEKYRVKVVPMEVVYNGRTYRDGIDLTPKHFYEMLASASGELPTTSAPPPETFLEIYRELAAEGKDILVVCASTKLTHVYESASIAARMFREKDNLTRLEVLDCGTAAGAQGFVVMDAAQAAQAGKGLDDVLSIMRESMKSVYVLVFLETLRYLARGGRVPQVVAWADSLLKIRTVIELRPLNHGVMLLGRLRSRTRALAKVLEILKKRAAGLTLRVMVQHTNAEEEAGALAAELRRWPACREVYISDFTPVMGVHTGPGLLGLSYSTYTPTEIEN